MEILLDHESLKYFNQDIFAKTAANILYDIVKNSTSEEVMKNIFDTKISLLSLHPNNIVLRNAIDFFIYKLPKEGLADAAKDKHIEIIANLDRLNKELSLLGEKKIKNGSTIFVHSMNNHVLHLLITASKKKHFCVNLLEHIPYEYGFHMKEKLKKHNIDAKLFPDLAMMEAVSESDSCFIGCDVITRNSGAIAKTGSSIAVDVANKHNIPVYLCAHSWKYDPKDETRNILIQKHKDKHDAGMLYEYIDPKKITAYITEHGILKPEHVLDEIKFYNNWMLIS